MSARRILYARDQLHAVGAGRECLEVGGAGGLDQRYFRVRAAYIHTERIHGL